MRRPLFAALLLAAGPFAFAQVPVTVGELSPDGVFTFAPAAGPDEVDRASDVKGTANPAVRPNTAGEFFLYARNPTQVEKTFTVDLAGDPGTPLAGRAKVSIAPGKWVRVRLAKPAPLVAVVPPVVVVPVPAVVVPAVPPGVEVARGPGGVFAFTVRLLDEDGKPVRDGDKRPYGARAGVRLRGPGDTFGVPQPKVTILANGVVDLAVTVATVPGVTGPPATVRLGLASIDGRPATALGEGVYLRTLDPAAGATTATLSARLPAVRPARMTVGVDGQDRAFVYPLFPQGAVASGQVLLSGDVAVRVRAVPPTAETPVVSPATQPVAGFPVVVEVDNAGDDARLELRLRPAGRTNAAGENGNEVVRLGGPRRDRVWVDAAGPTDGVLVTNTSADWVQSLDLRSLRGRVDVVAVLVRAGNDDLVSAAIPLTVDATAPDRVSIVKLPDAVEKGKPLPVEVAATDAENTPITKVVVYLGRPGDDGKLPADAVKADAAPAPGRAGVWVAALPLPADKKGPAAVTAQATNAAGLTTTVVKEIKLVDPPAPTGKIAGKVEYGGRPQPGLVVTLRDADNKEKATATTDAKGKFAFDKLAPGKYALSSARPDSGVGSRGAAPAQVEADKTASVTVTLTRMPAK